MPESLLVIGGGYIGLEMGSVYAELGSKVTVVELTADAAARRRPRPGQAAAGQAEQGCSRRSTWRPKSLRSPTRATRSKSALESAAGSRDRAIQPRAGVGRPPAEQRRPGIGKHASRNRSPRVSSSSTSSMRTADPHILAIGDVAGEPMLAHKATHQGSVAIEALLGEPAVFEPHAIPAVVFTDPEIAWAGLTEEQAKAEGMQSKSPNIPGPPAAGPRRWAAPKASPSCWSIPRPTACWASAWSASTPAT